MIITFSLFWIVIKNNILYVVRTGNVDGGGLFFPSAITQLFTGVYFMEICLIGLFFLVRDVQGKSACNAQGIIMSVTLVLTILYQIWLAMNFQNLYRYAPVRLESRATRRDQESEMERLTSAGPPSGPASESTAGEKNPQPLSHSTVDAVRCNTEADQEQDLSTGKSTLCPTSGASLASKHIQAQQRKDKQSANDMIARPNRPVDKAPRYRPGKPTRTSQGTNRQFFVPRRRDIERQMMNDPISKIIMQHVDELEDLDADNRDILTSVAFTHPILRETLPSVWIPWDELGVSDDELRRTVDLSQDIAIDNRGASFDRRLRVEVDKPPPDMSEFAFVTAEL